MSKTWDNNNCLRLFATVNVPVSGIFNNNILMFMKNEIHLVTIIIVIIL